MRGCIRSLHRIAFFFLSALGVEIDWVEETRRRRAEVARTRVSGIASWRVRPGPDELFLEPRRESSRVEELEEPEHEYDTAVVCGDGWSNGRNLRPEKGFG